MRQVTTWEHVEIIIGNLIADDEGYWIGIEIPYANDNERMRVWNTR